MRAEKRKKYIAILMASVLVLTVPLVWVRAFFAADELTIHDYADLPEWKTLITTQNGDVIYQDGCVAPELYGNLVGRPNASKEGNVIVNSITGCYAADMVPHSINPVSGVAGLEEADLEQLQTTLLSDAAHRAVQDAFDSHNGACAAYNYVTGEVYMLLSLPSGISLDKNAPAGSLSNICTSNRCSPGSTMKLIASICAAEQGIDPNFIHNCTGKLTLPDGSTVKCHKTSGHGKLNLEDAIGLSCNTYMAALIQKFDTAKTQETLRQLGFLLNGEQSDSRGSVSELSYLYSRTTFTTTREFKSVWGLIGQGETLVNPLHMLTIIGAIAGGGQTAAPYLVERIGTEEDVYFQAGDAGMLTLIDSQTASAVANHWRIATQKHYNVNERFTMLKTGTAEVNKSTNRLLMGVIEDCNTVFYISVSDTSGKEIYNIANALLEALPQNNA